MPRDTVQVHGTVAASPEAVWAVVRNFCDGWHPAIATIRAERDARGALIRAFTVTGEETLYREQLTWLSDSDRTLGYTHLQGIARAESYNARMSVTPAEGGGSTVFWTARVSADVVRLKQICEGTAEVFRAGMRIGRDHIASTIYTIVFAYAGGALAVLLLLYFTTREPLDLFGVEMFAGEGVRTLASAIGLILSVPITTGIAALTVGPAKVLTEPRHIED